MERNKQVIGETSKPPMRKVWPVPPGSIITSAYGNREAQSDVLKAAGILVAAHPGIDIITKAELVPIMAAAPGFVCYAEKHHKNYGKCFTLKHDDGSYTFYAHCLNDPPKMMLGYEAGEVCAIMGDTGFSKGVHLHFQVHTSFNPNTFGLLDPKRGGHTDPLRWLPPLEPFNIGTGGMAIWEKGALVNKIPDKLRPWMLAHGL
jgi:murein DD-endopeptidase MepM/ murein hydrolase activator NlpD